MIDAAAAPHTKIGMRKKVMPLARIVAVVTSILIELAIEEKPLIQNPSKNSTTPSGARRLSVA